MLDGAQFHLSDVWFCLMPLTVPADLRNFGIGTLMLVTSSTGPIQQRQRQQYPQIEGLKRKLLYSRKFLQCLDTGMEVIPCETYQAGPF